VSEAKAATPTAVASQQPVATPSSAPSPQPAVTPSSGASLQPAPAPNVTAPSTAPRSPSPSSTPSTLEREIPDLNKGVWVRGPNLPAPRQDVAAAVLAGRIYLIGGFGAHNEQMSTTLVWEPQVTTGEPHAEIERAGSRLGAWTYAAPIPEPVDHAAAVAVGSRIYVAGGRIENLVTNKFWRYDAGLDSWTELPSMPIPRYNPTMQAIGQRLYIIGGAVSHGRDAKSIMIYDIPTGQWSVRENALEYERIDLESAQLGNVIVVVGGRDDQDINLSACDLYDPARDRWFTCMNMHQPRSDFGLSVVNGRLVAVGGDDLRLYRPTQTMEISETALNGWLNGPWMPSPRHGMAQVTLGNVVWVIGGSSSSGTGPTTTVLRYVSPIVKVKFQGHT
jgi:N-acetylneuraminic acid mutarotase